MDDNYNGTPVVIAGVIPFIRATILLTLKIYFSIKKKDVKISTTPVNNDLEINNIESEMENKVENNMEDNTNITISV